MSKRTEKGTEINALENETGTETSQPSFTFTPLESTMEETHEGDAVVHRNNKTGIETEVEAGAELKDTVEYDYGQDATNESDPAESEESDETLVAPVLLREGPVNRPERVRHASNSREGDLDAERAVSGKMPSMREPRKNRSGDEFGQSEHKRSPMEQIDTQQRAMREMELAEKLKRDERKEPEIVIPEGTFNLKEDIQIELKQDAIKTILVQALNNKYRKEGLQVNPDIDDDLYFNIRDEDFRITATAKLCRVPVPVKVRLID